MSHVRDMRNWSRHRSKNIGPNEKSRHKHKMHVQSRFTGLKTPRKSILVTNIVSLSCLIPSNILIYFSWRYHEGKPHFLTKIPAMNTHICWKCVGETYGLPEPHNPKGPDLLFSQQVQRTSTPGPKAQTHSKHIPSHHKLSTSSQSSPLWRDDWCMFCLGGSPN